MFVNHVVIPLKDFDESSVCKEHPIEFQHLFCSKYSMAVCATCATLKHRETSHEIISVEEASKLERTKILDIGTSMQSRLDEINKKINELHTELRKLETEKLEITQGLDVIKRTADGLTKVQLLKGTTDIIKSLKESLKNTRAQYPSMNLLVSEVTLLL